MEMLPNTSDSNMRQKQASASTSSRKASCMVIGMKVKLTRLSSFRSLNRRITAMRVPEWSCTSTRNLPSSNRLRRMHHQEMKEVAIIVTSEEAARAMVRELNNGSILTKLYSTLAKRETKVTNSGSKARAERSIEPQR